jgi:hypothetical protein
MKFDPFKAKNLSESDININLNLIKPQMKFKENRNVISIGRTFMTQETFNRASLKLSKYKGKTFGQKSHLDFLYKLSNTNKQIKYIIEMKIKKEMMKQIINRITKFNESLRKKQIDFPKRNEITFILSILYKMDCSELKIFCERNKDICVQRQFRILIERVENIKVSNLLNNSFNKSFFYYLFREELTTQKDRYIIYFSKFI